MKKSKAKKAKDASDSSKKKKTKSKTPAAMVTLFFTLIAPSLGAFGLLMTEQVAHKEWASNTLSRFVTANYISQMGKAFDHLNLMLQPLVQSSTLHLSLMEKNQLGIDVELDNFKQLNPAVASIRAIPFQSIHRATQANPRMSFAEFDLMRQLEKGEVGQPELIESEGKELIQLGKVIRKDDNILGTVLMIVDKKVFDKFFTELPRQMGYFRLAQQTKDKPRTWIELGEDFKPDQEPEKELVKSYGHSWRFEYKEPKAFSGVVQELAVKSATAGLGVSLLLMLIQVISNRAWRSAINRNLQILASKVLGRSDGLAKFSYTMPGFSEVEETLKERLYAFTKRTTRRKKKLSQTSLSTETSASSDDILDMDLELDDDDLFESIDFTETDSMTEAALAKKKTIADKPEFAGIFRQYDIRGIVGETLDAEAMELIGKAIGTVCLREGELSIVVGRDGRLSSPSLSKSLIAGLMSTGCNVIDIGIVPTPVVYFGTNTLSTNSGVMITGSHNPSNYNGLKIMIKGVTLHGSAISNLLTIIQNEDFLTGSGNSTSHNIKDVYINKICSDISLNRQVKVVVDTGNGVAGPFVKELLTRLGCETICLNEEIDGNFPNHHPDPSKPENLRQLINEVKKSAAEFGLAFDGDGDRLGLVTPSGEIVYPDRILMLYVKDILAKNPGGEVIFDVKCTSDLAKWVVLHEGKPTMWKTGHSLIKAKLKETGALIAGEMSGHIFFNDRWFGFDDALYSAARLLEIVSNGSKNLSTLVRELPKKISTPEINVPVSETAKFKIIDSLVKSGKFEGESTTLDGLRVDYPFGWGLVRASNTTPNLVTRFEADTVENLDKIKGEFKTNLKSVMGEAVDLPF